MWGGWAIPMLFGLFVASEALSIFVGMRACRGAKHRHLMAWVPSLHFYFPLGCLAGWKAIYEGVTKPFYWDKTAHGLFVEAEAAPADAPLVPGMVSIPLVGQIGGIRLEERAANMEAVRPAPAREAPAAEAPAAAPQEQPLRKLAG